MQGYYVSEEDKLILRDLAKKQVEIANSPKMIETVKNWYLHNDLKGEKPMFTIETWTFGYEIQKQLKCKSDDGRKIEGIFYNVLANHEFIGDDKTVAPFFAIGYNSWFKPFDITVVREFAKDSLGHHFKEVITDLEVDFPKLKESTYAADGKETALLWKSFLEDIFGDILPVEFCGNCLGSSPTQDVVHFMGLENMLFSMYDCPDTFHKFMDKLTDDYITYFRWLEVEKLLLPTTSFGHLAQGSLCFTNDLKSSGEVSLKDLWLYMDSQESSGISPNMYAEFVFPYIKKISDNFGLFSYGCCEAVDSIYESCIKNCENLRKISISAWCNEDIMGEALKGSKTIYLRKPSPNFLGVGKIFDEDAWRQHIITTLKAARGCKLEFSQRDVYTLGGDLSKLTRATKIAREAIEDYWQ